MSIELAGHTIELTPYRPGRQHDASSSRRGAAPSPKALRRALARRGAALEVAALLDGRAPAAAGSNKNLAGAARPRWAPWLLAASTLLDDCLLYTSPSPRDGLLSRMPSSA